MKSKQPSKNIEADKDKFHFCFAKCRFPTWQQYSLEKSIKVSYSALNFPRGLMKWWWPGINSPFKSLEGRQCRKLPPKLFTHCCYNTGQSWKLPPVAKIVTIQGTWAITITGPEKSWYLNVFPWKWIHWCCPTNLYWGEEEKYQYLIWRCCSALCILVFANSGFSPRVLLIEFRPSPNFPKPD